MLVRFVAFSDTTAFVSDSARLYIVWGLFFYTKRANIEAAKRYKDNRPNAGRFLLCTNNQDARFNILRLSAERRVEC